MTETTMNPPAQTWECARRQIGNGMLSIIMPAFNLGSVIAANLKTVQSTFSGHIPFEIVVVDDGSSDATRTEIESAARNNPLIKPVVLARNKGKGTALKEGFEASRGNYILFLDADLDLPPAQAANFFDLLEKKQVDIVIGCKRHPESIVESYPWHRRVTSSVYFYLVKMLIGLPLRDTQTGIKLFKREVLEYAFPRMLVKTFAFDIELLAIAHDKGYSLAESAVLLNMQGVWAWVKPATITQIVLDTMAVFYRQKVLKYYQSIPSFHAMPSPPLVSIVIAYPAPSTYLDEALAGIAHQTYDHYEVILLPNDASGRTWPAGIREIPTGPIRPAEKRNIGVEHSKGTIIAFLDDDAAPLEDWLKQAVLNFTVENVAAVGGPASTPPNDPYLAELSGEVYANRLVSGPYRYRYEMGLFQDVEDYPSCNLLVRNDVMKKLGGFRTDFWPGEDTYLCLDIIKKLGMRIVYDPRVAVYHHRRKLFLPHLRQIGRYAMHRGYFAKKFPETSRKISYMIPSFFAVGVIAGAVLTPFFPILALPYFAALSIYAVISLASAFRLNPVSWLLIWLGVVVTHMVYGCRFIVGVLADRLPGEVQRFDHPSEMKKET